MRFGSVCSGVEAASLAWESLGWQSAWFAEIAPFPSAVLAHRWPYVPNHGDMTTLAARIACGEVEAPDVLVGGTPCQAFSIAGLRRGLDDPRGGLTIEYVRILNAIDAVRQSHNQQPAIAVWENVPGVLSNQDNAFGCFLAALAGENGALVPAGARWADAGCVYGPQRAMAWRVLDAQYFGVAQRRRRVILVASADPGFDPAAVLFEWQGLRRDIAPGRAEGQTTATTVAGCPDDEGLMIMAHGQSNAEIRTDGGAPTLTCNHEAPIIVHGRQDPLLSNVAHPLSCQNNGMDNVICIKGNIIDRAPQHGGNGFGIDDSGTAYTLTASDRHGVIHGDVVRRLMPVECERLQGMPDNHTRVPWRGKTAEDCPDGPRYEAIGNSMAVPVMRWIGERIDLMVMCDTGVGMNWKSFNDPPKQGTRFVALYADGSGAGVFWLNDKGALVNAEGDYLGRIGEAWFGDAVFSFWAELPEGYQMFFESLRVTK